MLISNDDTDIAVMQMLRDHVRFPDIVWEVAARVISVLGPFGYSSLHIRRNDLQYKQVFVAAKATLDNTAPLFNEGEPLYISTDETSATFFDAMRAHHPVYQWADFFKEHGKFALRGVHIPRKLIGCIEQVPHPPAIRHPGTTRLSTSAHLGASRQVICAAGRRFVGTQHSTFTSYIVRLRGYLDAPDTGTYFHNTKNSADDPEAKRKKVHHHRGSDYMTEDPRMWAKTTGKRRRRRHPGPH